MKISIMGTRGIPARYGGFETLAEELSVRLVKSGHEVTVYCRKKYRAAAEEEYKGVKLVYLPSINSKYLETVVHTFLSVIHNIFFLKTDSVLLCNCANAVFIPGLKLFGRRVAINVDGLEWKRKKWNIFGKLWHRLGEFFSVIFADKVITDSRVIEKYYKDKFKKDTVFIPYGADVKFKGQAEDFINQLGLEKGKYVLYVGRLEPENNADAVIKAFNNLNCGLKLAVVGDAPYSSEYKRSLRKSAGPDIVFCGAVYSEDYKAVLSGASFCINATEVGGTHPAIVEAMAAGKLVLVNAVAENLETIGDAGISFDINKEGSLRDVLSQVINNPKCIDELAIKARERVEKFYLWDDICSKYVECLKTSCKLRSTRRTPQTTGKVS